MWQPFATNGTKASHEAMSDVLISGSSLEAVPLSSVHLMMIATGFMTGSCVGWVLHRSDYCVAGMFRDLFLFRSTVMMKTFLLFLAVSLPLFELVRLSGLVLFPLPKFGPPSGVNLLGGFLFGVGMVLAGGCAVGTLYKMGAGSFPAFLAFIGMITGSLLFALLHPSWSLFSKALALPTRAITLPELVQLPSGLVLCCLLLIMIPLLWRWFRHGSICKTAVVDGYLQPWQAAVALALLATFFLLFMGLPMGITTSNAKLGGMLVQLIAPEQYAAIAYFHKNSFHYLPPYGGGELIGGAGAAFDGVALVQYPLILGIIAGSAWSAVRLGEWQFHLRLPWPQVVSALLGGIMMGLASRMAPSCYLWHLFGGLPALKLESVLFFAGMLPGAWIGGILLTRLVLTR